MRLPTSLLPRAAFRVVLALALSPLAAHAADAPATSPAPAPDQVIVPDVDRRDVRLPKFPSSDVELGLFGGSYSTDNFGTSGVGGLRLGYHITEDFFVEGSFGFSRVSDKAFRQILPGGVFASGTDTLRYRELSLGWNALPGEVFLGGKYAKASAVYLIAGLGTTSFDQQRSQTFSYGMGMRVFLKDWFAVRFDVRDHVFVYDLLGARTTANNPELTTGMSVLF